MTAMANSGCPTIGRIVSRSMTRPKIAASASAINTWTKNTAILAVSPSAGASGLSKGNSGKPPSEMRMVMNMAPAIESAPAAKFRTWVALKMMTKPSAIKT